MHDVTLTYFTAPDCPTCETFSPVMRAAAAQRTLPVTTVDVRDEPERAAMAGVRVVPAVVMKVDGIPVARLDGAVNGDVLADFIDSAELSDVIR